MENNDEKLALRHEQAAAQIEAGQHLQNLRKLRGLSLSEAVTELNIARTYLSEIENGRKMPSDKLIIDLAKFYGEPEDELFRRWGKIPLNAREEMIRSRNLQRTISEISRDTRLTAEDRDRIYDKLSEIYIEMTK